MAGRPIWLCVRQVGVLGVETQVRFCMSVCVMHVLGERLTFSKEGGEWGTGAETSLIEVRD